MNIKSIIQQIKNISFRPISIELLVDINSYLNKVIENDFEKKKIYDSIFQMNLSDFLDLVCKCFFMPNAEYDEFSVSCICSRIGYIEKNSFIPHFEVSRLKWQRYLNLSMDSSVSQYSLNETFIAVLFKTGNKIYVYSYSKTGLLGTEFMKMCADRGDGLGHCTSKYFKNHQGFTVIDL